MKIILFYNGKTGFTKRYADWIVEELGCEVKSYKDFTNTPIEGYDMVIFGSRVHAGRIEHLAKVKGRIKDNLIVFAVGATPIAAENSVKKIWDENFTETELAQIPHFYMQSGLDYGKMGFIDRTIMKSVAKMMSKKQYKDDEEAGFAQAITGSYDIAAKEHITPLIEYVKRKTE